MINVVADKYLFELEDMISDGVEFQLYDPEEGLPGNLEGTDALLIRTVIPINSETISKLPDSLSFIGTGSAGTDHVDKELLSDKGITFANAPGCNARSVAEYVCTALLIWADEKKVPLFDKTIGIVGVGNVGSELNKMLQKLGVSTICYDPPREIRDSNFKSSSLSKVLEADILTLHTPLEKSGDYPTYHWLDEDKLSKHRFDLVLNTARGGVVDEQALLNAKSNGSVGNFIIDVWENEPEFNDAVANSAFIFTPHIAGYSIQAKQRATSMIIESMCKHFSIPFSNSPLTRSKKISIAEMDISQPSLTNILHEIHPLKKYQNRLAKLTGKKPKEKRRSFNELRAQFPLRNEYKYLSVPKELIATFPVLGKLGISAE